MSDRLEDTSVQLAKRLAALSSAQQALFQRKIKQKAVDLSQLEKITVQCDRQRFPLSFMQKQLWFLSQLEPDSTAYNVPLSLRLKGSLDISVLEQAFTLLFQRQDVLRTTFFYDESGEEDEPFQVVTPLLKFALPLIDLQHLPAVEGEQIANQLIRSVLQRPFDLAARPLVRLLLLRIQPENHVLLLCLHHILCDGRSCRIVIEEMVTIYTDLIKKNPVSLPELPIQYGDYAVWQRNYLQGERLAELLRYWVNHLRDVPSLKLPYDHPRRSGLSAYADKVRFELSHQTLTSLRALCQEESITLFMLLLACFQVLLWYLTQQEKIVVGVSINNRRQPEISNLIGLFVNLLPLQTDFRNRPTFREILKQVRITCIDGYSYQDLPFEKIVQALPLERLGSYVPLIQVAFDFQNGAPHLAEDAPLQVEYFSDISADQPRFDLTLRLSGAFENMQGALEYDHSLFEETTIVQIARQFILLIGKLVQAPDSPLHEISSAFA